MGRIRATGLLKHVILIAMVVALNFAQLTGAQVSSGSPEPRENRHSDDTVRVDPLDNLNKYRGGYDITNVHYWSSTAFTGIYGYAIAALWLLCGIGYAGFLIVRATCCKRKSRKLKKRSPCRKQCYRQPLLLAMFFTLLTITACGVVLGGNERFHSRAKTIIDIIIDTADEASETIYNTTGAMKNMSSSLGEVGGNSQATNFLTSTSRRLDTQAADIGRQASRNRRLIERILKIVYVITTVTISLTLTITIALLVFGILKFQRTIQVLITLCWIFTVLCWVFFGVYFFLQNFAGDTCTALESFRQDPYNNSLSSILPCDQLLSAESVLDDVSSGIYNLVNQVNENISTSYGDIVRICNPFSPPPMYEYQPLNCSATEIRIGDVPRVLRLLACPDSEGGPCNGGIRIPASYYNTVEAYSTSLQTLLDVYPGMDSLLECRTVRNAFDEILQKHCRPLKRYARMVWAALVVLSVVLVGLVVVWIIRERHEKIHHSHSLGSSVKPHSTDMLECGTDKPTDKVSTTDPAL